MAGRKLTSDADRASGRAQARGVLPKILEEAQQLICAGHTDELIRRREAFLSLLRSRALTPAERLFTRVCSSMVHLVLLRKDEAAQSFPGVMYDKKRGKVAVDEAELRSGVEGSPFLAGLVYLEVANLLHRTWQPADGIRVADLGLKLLANPEAAEGFPMSPLCRELLECSATAWWARLAWQTGRDTEALLQLEELHLRLIRLRARGHRIVGGIDLATGIVLDLMADLRAIRGEHSRALEEIYEAQSVLEYGKSRDFVRKAHVLYTAAKIVGTQAGIFDPSVPVLLFDKAIRTYPPGHPLRFRAMNRKVRTLMLGHKVHEAALLMQATKALKQAMSSLATAELPPDERRYCEAEMKLTEIFILEREASRPRSSPTLRHQCLEKSALLVTETAGLPNRLQLESTLHHALARIRYADITAGRREIDDALERVEREGTSTSQIASLLARTELLQRTGTPQAAEHQWLEASRLLTSVRSTYLRDWCDSLATQLHLPIVVRIDPDAQFKEAEARFKRSYLEYQLKRHGGANFKTLEMNIGLSRSQIYRLMDEHGIPTPRQR